MPAADPPQPRRTRLQLGASPAIQAQLAGAADLVSLAWPAWRAIARHWDTVSTGIHHRRDISPVAAELGDLVLRTGRLAYSNPDWTPACANASPARDPANLAATVSDLRVVLAAVHHATDAISCIAACDTEAVRDAASGSRLYLPTRLLPENYDIPCRYTPVPPPLAAELLRGYNTAASASLHAAIALDDIAVTIDAPSSMLAAARTPARPPASRSDVADHDNARQQALPARPAKSAQPEPGPTEQILRSLQITEPGMLLRAAAIDDAARDLVANANASSRHRGSLNHSEPRQIPQAAGRAARTAARDLPTGTSRPGWDRQARGACCRRSTRVPPASSYSKLSVVIARS